MESNFAVLSVLLVVVTQVYLYLSRTTALGVLHDGSFLLARCDLFTDGPVLHLVTELKVGIILDGNLDLLDREAFLLVFAVEGSWLFLLYLVLDALRVEAALGKVVPLAKGLITLPASLEVEVLVSGEVTLGDILPVVAFLLFVGALVVVVLWCVEAACMSVPGSSNLLGSEPGQEKSD
jgi:hypothetical protein